MVILSPNMSSWSEWRALWRSTGPQQAIWCKFEIRSFSFRLSSFNSWTFDCIVFVFLSGGEVCCAPALLGTCITAEQWRCVICVVRGLSVALSFRLCCFRIWYWAVWFTLPGSLVSSFWFSVWNKLSSLASATQTFKSVGHSRMPIRGYTFWTEIKLALWEYIQNNIRHT